MTKFKHKNGGICEVLTRENIDRLRKNPNYKEIAEKSKETKNENNKSLDNDRILENNKPLENSK